MDKNLQDYRINNFPGGFSRIIESWFEIIHQYEENTRYDYKHGDAIYWYNERANVGAFAAALTRNNLSVIEEYSCLKGKGADKGPGRADLSFCYRNVWYLVEAKLKWKKLALKSRQLNPEEIVTHACNDVECTWQQDKEAIPFGLTFVVPYIPSGHSRQINEHVEDIIQQLEDKNPCDLWAYCAPGRLRRLQSSAASKNYFPMVLILANKI